MAVCVALAMPAIWPLLASSGLPVTDDTYFHLSRVSELREALGSDGLYPRWVYPFTEALGFPVFNYYAPLPYYLCLALVPFGFDLAGSLKAICVIMPLIAAATMFLWMRHLLGELGLNGRSSRLGALVAAVAYASTPHLLMNIYYRGSYAEVTALAVLPLCLLAIDRMRRRADTGSVILAAFTFAALLLSHNMTAMVGGTLLAAYGLYRIVLAGTIERPPDGATHWRGHLVRLALSAVGMATLTAFLWLPALFERGYSAHTFERLKSGDFDIAVHSAYSWPPVQWQYPFQHVFEHRFRSELAHSLLATLGLLPIVAYCVQRMKHGLQAALGIRPMAAVSAFFVVASAVILFLLSPLSLNLWTTMPLLDSMQFPWRTIAALTVCFSALLGIGVAWLAARMKRIGWAVALISVVLLLVGSLGRLDTPMLPVDTINDDLIHRVTSLGGWYLEHDAEGRDLTAEEMQSVSAISYAKQSPGVIDLRVEASAETTLAVHSLYHPGWTVTIDGQESTALRLTPRDLLGFSVGAGSHDIHLEYGDTLLRTVGNWLTLLGGLIVVLLLLAKIIARKPAIAATTALLLALVVWLVPRATALDAISYSYYAANQVEQRGLRLLGAGMETFPDRRLVVQIWWQSMREQPREDSFVVVANSRGETAGYARRAPLGSYPLDTWQLGEIVMDRVEIEIPTGFDPSDLVLHTGFRGQGYDDPASVAFSLEPSGHLSETPSDKGAALNFGNVMRLDSVTLAKDTLSPGDVLEARLKWFCLGTPPSRVSSFAHVVDAQGKTWAQFDGTPGPSRFPALLWSQGDVVAESRALKLPSDIPPGRYSLVIGVYTWDTGKRLGVSAGDRPLSDTAIAVSSFVVN